MEIFDAEGATEGDRETILDYYNQLKAEHEKRQEGEMERKYEAPPGIMQGEKDAVCKVLELGKLYGYGNLISHLKRRWMLQLMDGGLTEEAAALAADTSAYKDNYLHLDEQHSP